MYNHHIYRERQAVSKSSVLFHFLGSADELNAHLGLVKAMLSNENLLLSACRFIEEIQKNIMKMMSHAADSKNNNYFFTDNDVADIEKEIDKLKKNIHELTEFVIPGKNITEAQIQITRTAARRAERFFTALSEELQDEQGTLLCPKACVYINRLSNYLFFLSQQNY